MRLKGRLEHLTRLGEPQPIPVRAPHGEPVALRIRERWYPVEQVRERWRVDDGWWKEHPDSWMYFELLLEGGMLVTVYRDLAAESRQVWYRQNYGQPQEPTADNCAPATRKNGVKIQPSSTARAKPAASTGPLRHGDGSTPAEAPGRSRLP